MKLKTPDEYAREFKLPACVGNKKFATQIKVIQADALNLAVNIAQCFPQSGVEASAAIYRKKENLIK